MNTDLRKISTSTAPIRCEVNDDELYEVRIEALAKLGKGGASDRVRVYHSADGGQTWSEVLLKLTCRAWWELVYNYVGGDLWPPRGEDVDSASIKDGQLTFRYSNLYQSNQDDTVTRWEARYWPAKRRWSIHFFEKY